MGKREGKRGKRRRIPERTCVACRRKAPKGMLVRIVRTPEGEIVVDERGKRNGRGAYLCRNRSCWERAIERGSLARALRTALTAEQAEALLAYAASLPASADEPAAGLQESGRRTQDE